MPRHLHFTIPLPTQPSKLPAALNEKATPVIKALTKLPAALNETLTPVIRALTTEAAKRVALQSASAVAYTAAVIAIAPHVRMAMSVRHAAQAARVPILAKHGSAARHAAAKLLRRARAAGVSSAAIKAAEATLALRAASRALPSIIKALRRLVLSTAAGVPTPPLTPPSPMGALQVVTSRLPPIPKAAVWTVLGLFGMTLI